MNKYSIAIINKVEFLTASVVNISIINIIFTVVKKQYINPFLFSSLSLQYFPNM